MIYKISVANMPAAFNKGASLVIMSNTGTYGLMQNLQDTDGVEITETYNDNELDNLLALPEWQQPCPACEV